MSTAKLILPRLHAAQRQVLAGAGKRNVLCCGRRWGKSLFVCGRLIETPKKGILAGCSAGWFTATNKIADEVWELAKATLAPITTRKDEQHRIVETCINGAKLEVWSLESAGVALGRRYGVVAIDEAAIVPNLRLRWMREIRPTLTDYRGDAWFPSTPRGRVGDFHDLYQLGARPPTLRKGWASWHMPSATNPHLSADEIEEAREEYEDAGRLDLFRQEYLAEFVTSDGAVFDPSQIHEGPLPRITHLYMGIDPALTAEGMGRGDQSAMAVIGIDELGRWWLVDLIAGRWRADGVAERVWAAWEQHKPVYTWLEGGPAGLGVEPWLRRMMDDNGRGWRLDMMSHLREKLAKNAAAAALVNTGKLWVPTGAPWLPGLREQLAAFTGAKSDKDDLVDALGIAVRGCQMVATTRPEPEPPKPQRERAVVPLATRAKEAERRAGATRGPIRHALVR